jgi:hypothetical protein
MPFTLGALTLKPSDFYNIGVNLNRVPNENLRMTVKRILGNGPGSVTRAPKLSGSHAYGQYETCFSSLLNAFCLYSVWLRRT